MVKGEVTTIARGLVLGFVDMIDKAVEQCPFLDLLLPSMQYNRQLLASSTDTPRQLSNPHKIPAKAGR